MNRTDIKKDQERFKNRIWSDQCFTRDAGKKWNTAPKKIKDTTTLAAAKSCSNKRLFTKKLHKVISCSLFSVRIDTEYNNGNTNIITYYN